MPLVIIAIVNPDQYGVVDTQTRYEITAGIILIFVVIAAVMHLMSRSKQ
jgi:hypothetical protein